MMMNALVCAANPEKRKLDDVAPEFENVFVAPERAAIRPRRAFGRGDVSLPRARTNDVGVLLATDCRDSPTVLSQQASKQP